MSEDQIEQAVEAALRAERARILRQGAIVLLAAQAIALAIALLVFAAILGG